VHITPNKDGSFVVTGNPPGTSSRGGGALNHRDFADVGPWSRWPRLSHVMLTAEQIKAHGLGPI